MSLQIVKPAASILKSTSFSGLPGAALLRMADAGNTVVDCISELHASGTNLVIEALHGSSNFTEWEHYPPEDVHDPKSHAQYYFHAHPPDDREAPDYGHFHTFMRSKGMPAGLRPAEAAPFTSPTGNDSLSHLIAISMTPTGMPERLFTTNRWVTGETWYKAADVITMLDRFVIELDHPSPRLNQWLTAMFVLFKPWIEGLLMDRDRAIERWRMQHPGEDALEDRRLEITSSIDISLYEHIEWLDRQLAAVAPA